MGSAYAVSRRLSTGRGHREPQRVTLANVLRMLLTRRWITFLVVVVALAFVCIELGRWQFHRLHDRLINNAIVRANLDAKPAPATAVLTTTSPTDAFEWRRVSATGTYDAANTVLLKYQTRDGRPGVDVIVPLRVDDGRAVLVDRGWVPGPDNGNVRITPPSPPSGKVTVTGWLRQNASEGGASTVYDGQVRAISSDQIGQVLPYPVYGGYLTARAESPRGARTPARDSGPDLSSGPHFFYGLQWYFFALLAVGGFGYFAYLENEERKHPELVRGRAPRANALPPVPR